MNGQEENIEDIINYFAISLFGQSTVEDILWDLTKNCISRLGFEDCVIYLLDEKRDVLIQKAAHGPKNPKDYTIFQPIEIPVGKGIVGSVAKHGLPELIPDTSKDPRYIKDDAFRYSEISVPITLDNNVIGVIDSEHSQRNFFNDRHLRILSLIATLCANKIMWAKAEEKVRAEQEALFKAEHQLSEFKLHALRSQMNPHFIFNSLNTIQYYITEKETGQALHYLSLFGKFIRRILNASSQTFIPLSEEIAILKGYLKLEKMRFQERFDYVIETDPFLDPDEIRLPVLLIHPFVERTLIEGLLNRDKIGIVDIHFTRDGEFFQCWIKCYDDIPGVKTYSNPLHRKTSLEGGTWWDIHERIELLNRLHNTNIQVGLIGTLTEIKMPLQNVLVK